MSGALTWPTKGEGPTVAAEALQDSKQDDAPHAGYGLKVIEGEGKAALRGCCRVLEKTFGW